MKKLSIIYVYYNEFTLLKESLQKLVEQLPQRTEIIIVDNNSEINCSKTLKKKYPQIIYIRNNKNIGFARAANIGLKKAKGEFLLLLTPDTQLLPGTVQQTLMYIDHHPDVAIVGCPVFSGKKQQPSAGKAFPSIISHFFEYNQLFYLLMKKMSPFYDPIYFSLEEHTAILEVKHMIGAYLLMRKSAIQKEGYFDTYYYMYREETDLCKRLSQVGWKLVYLPMGGILHKENPHKKIKITQSNPYYLQNTYFFFTRYYGRYVACSAYVLAGISVICNMLIVGMYGVIQKKMGRMTQSYMLISVWKDIFLWHKNHIMNILMMRAQV